MGVSAMICDSTNIFSPGRAGSESSVRDSLLRIMELKTNRILVTSFASNVARMESIFYCAKKTERNLCLVGRSMQRIYKAAKKCGYLKGLVEPIDPREAKKVPKNKILYLHKNDLDKLDDLDEEAKQGMCDALSKFYLKIAHVFASITASINPTYTYTTRAGKKLTFNTLNRGEMDKYNIARSEVPKVEFVSFCGRRVDCLSSGLEIDSLTDPKETFTIQPGFCSVNKNKDGTVRDLFDEPGMAEIKQLYYDKMDDKTKKYTGMSEQAEKDYKERLVKFWKLLSDKPPPNDLTYMSQITLRQFHNERGLSLIHI